MTNTNLHPRSVLKLDALSEATEAWNLIPVSSATPRSQDRTRAWELELEDLVDEAYVFLPEPVQTRIIDLLRDAEAEAMRSQLQEIAHEFRAPRWHPSTSKIALPPEDTKPYKPQAFQRTLEIAHDDAFNQLDAITCTAALEFLKDTLRQLDTRGWEVEFDLEEERHPEPTLTTEHYDDERVIVLGIGSDQALEVGFDPVDGLALNFAGHVTEQDAALLHLATGALQAAPAATAFPNQASTGADHGSAAPDPDVAAHPAP